MNIINGGGFSFPILTNPISAAELLLGGNADIMDYQTPLLSFGRGAVNGDGVPSSVVPLAQLPIIPGVLNMQIGGAVGSTDVFRFIEGQSEASSRAGHDQDYVHSGGFDPVSDGPRMVHKVHLASRTAIRGRICCRRSRSISARFSAPPTRSARKARAKWRRGDECDP